MTEMKIIPNHQALFEQFFREFQVNIDAAIRDAEVDEERDTLKPVRDSVVALNIAIQNIDSVALLVSFRTRLMGVVEKLAAEHDKLVNAVENPEDEDEDSDEPDEDALTTTDHIRFYQYGKLAFTYDENGPTVDLPDGRALAIEAVNDEYTVEEAIRVYMDHAQFWPDAWFISDHGNAHRIDLSKPEVKA